MDEELRKALKILEKQKQKARRAGDLAEEANIYNIAGKKLAGYRLFEEAIKEHQMELQLSESLNDTIAVAIAHRKLGECLCELQDFKQALFHQQKHLELSRKCQNIVEEQRALATIGRTLFQSAVLPSELRQAQSAFLESLSICGQLRDTVEEKELLEMRARLYLNLGSVDNSLKNPKKGVKYIEKALAITVNHSLKETEYRCHFSIGVIKLAENHPAEALQCFQRASKAAQHQGMKFEEADTLVQMGQILLQLGDFKGAKKILKKCFKTMKHPDMIAKLRSSLIKAIKGTRYLEKLDQNKAEAKDEALMKTYEDLGDLYSSVKCYSKAIHYYLKQLELSQVLEKSNEEKAVNCFSIAQSYSDNKQYNKAKEYFHKELLLLEGKPQEKCDTWCKMAEVSELAGDSLEEIEKAYNNALECASKCENGKRKLRVLKLLSGLRRKQEKDEDECKILMDTKIEEDSETSEEQSEEEESDDDDGDILIEEEMEFSDSDDEQQDAGKSSTARSKRNAKSIYKRNEKGETVLHVAAINGDYHLAKSSIEKGVSVHARDYCGWQPLHEACNHGNLAVVELLLDSGADIDDPGGPHCRGMTPLHDAVQNGHIDVVKLLISRGASTTKRNNDGHTPLGLVLHSIEEDDDDSSDLDPDLVETRENLTRILRNAASTGKSESTKVPELRRRDKLEFSDDSDVESSQDFSENVSKNTEEISRKRKSALLELDSDEENTSRNSMNVNGKKSKVAKVSKNTERVSWLDNESENDGTIRVRQDRVSDTSRRGILRDDSDYSETSRDSMDGLEALRSDSRNSEDAIELDSDPLDAISSPLPSLFDYSDPLDIPQVPSPSRTPSQGRKRMFQLRLSSKKNKNDASFNSSSKNNTTKSVLRMSNIVSRTNSATFRNNAIPSKVSRTAKTISKSANRTGYVDPVTGTTQEDSDISENQPALIPENEYLSTATDAWLVDDMPKKTGKRKRSGNLLSMLSPSESSRDNCASSRMRSSASRSVSITSGSQRRVSQTSTQREHTTNTGGNKHRLRQSRLNVVSGRSSPNEFWDDAPSEPSPLSSGVTTLPMRLRVKVKDKMFLIPCPIVLGERKTVQWLAEQATFRYHSDTGLKPILSLSTTEGAALSPTDLITDVLSNNELVNATVESWDLPPIAERYKVSCLMASTEVQKKILDVFEGNPHISNVEFSNMSLTAVALLPLFRTLQCHDQLVRLALPGNRLGDSGLQHFISSLPCLSNLSVLILTCNGITHKGLRNLASSLTQDDKVSKAWSNLKELDISFNTVTDIAHSSLATILRSCPDLQILNIESCALTHDTFQQRSVLLESIQGLKRLHHLNVSRNKIQAEGLSSLLGACNSVEILNVSSTVSSHDPAFTPTLADYLHVDNCCVQKLICRGCFLNDKDISILARVMKILTSDFKLDLGQNNITNEGASKLIESLECNPNLKHLNLSGNVKVSNDVLLTFLTRPSNLEYLDLSCCGISSPIPEHLVYHQSAFSTQLKYLNLSYNSLNQHDIETLLCLWKSTWREKTEVYMSKSIVVFYAKEC